MGERISLMPLICGQFGPVYANPRWDEDAEAINEDRYSKSQFWSELWPCTNALSKAAKY